MEENVIQIHVGITINVLKTSYMRLNLESCYMQLQKWKYLASIIDNSVITYDEIIEEETKTVTTIFNEKNEICKKKKSVFYFPSLHY